VMKIKDTAMDKNNPAMVLKNRMIENANYNVLLTLLVRVIFDSNSNNSFVRVF